MSTDSCRTDDQHLSVGGTVTTRIVQAELHLKYEAVISSENVRPSPSAEVLGSDGIQSELVDYAISRISCNLPSEVMRVTTLQRHQNSQISTLQSELQQLEEQNKKELQKSAEVKEEIERIRRQTYLLEEDSAKRTKRCIHHKNEILALVKDCDAKRRMLSARRTELYTTKSKLMKYTQKLDEYITSVSVADTTTEVQTAIAQLEERLASLQEKKDYMEENPEETARIFSGSVERDVKDVVAQLNAQSDQLSEEINQIQQKVDSIREKQEQVKQDATVLRKRNAAQLLRLKHQVKEQQLRHRQWTEQSRLLQQNVNALNQKLQSA